MQSSDFFNLLPAFIFWLLALSFFVLWRIRIIEWLCSAGFFFTGTGFALDAHPTWGLTNQFLSGLCYMAAAYLYSGFLLSHFGKPVHSRIRVSATLLFVPVHAYLVFVAQSLRADLFLIDMLFAAAFFQIFKRLALSASNAADRFLVIASTLTALECVVRSVLFTFLFSNPVRLEEFASSNYSVMVQIATLTIGLLFPMAALAAAASRAIEAHRDAADLDPLTALLNRRGFSRVVPKVRTERSLSGSLLIADIDHFKKVNDQFGHHVGDKVIQGLASELRQGLDHRAIIARFGGEEFMAYLPDATVKDALAAANTISQSFRTRDWQDHAMTSPITVSMGITNVDEEDVDLDTAFERADKALYVAKDSGRDQVVVNEGRLRLLTENVCTLNAVSPATSYHQSAVGDVADHTIPA